MTSKRSTSSNDNHSTTLSFEYDTPETVAHIAHSIRQEVDEIPGDRTTGQVHYTESVVVVRIRARDLPAMRAGVQTWCSLVDAAEATLDTVTA